MSENNTPQKSLQIAQSIHTDRLELMQKILNEDCANLLAASQRHSDSQFYRRAYIRAVFALIEGMTYAIKQVCLHHGQQNSTLSDLDLRAIRETEVKIKDNGEVKELPGHTMFLPNLKLMFRVFKLCFSSSFVVQYNHIGWTCIDDGQKVRNRLAHPKEIESLDVTPLEMKKCMMAHKWFTVNVALTLGNAEGNEQFFEEYRAGFEAKLNEMRI